MSYKERLNPWAIVRFLPDMQRVIIERFRSPADAEGYLKFLRQEMPHGKFEVVFDYPPTA